MQLGLWKPSSRSRHFVAEVGVIVIGVLIALSAEQFVSDWEWKRKAGDARQAIKAELQIVSVDAHERLAVEGCINSQLDKLAETVVGADGTVGPIEMVLSGHIPTVLRTPSREWSQTSWDSTITDGVRPHLKRDLEKLDLVYSQVAWLRSLDRDAIVARGTLSVLAHRIEVDPVVKAQLLGAIETERARAGEMALLSEQTIQTISELGFAPPREAVDERVRASRSHGTLAWCLSRGLKT